MKQLTARGLDTFRESNPQGYTALLDIVKSINSTAAAIGVGTLGPANPPSAAGLMLVLAADGIFDVAIVDNAPQRGEYYFIEWDLSAQFTNAKSIPLGPVRNWRGMLGNATLFWRWYKQLLGSNVSEYIYFGGNTPVGVAGGGVAGPATNATQGSGNSSATGQGWGTIGATQAQAANL